MAGLCTTKNYKEMYKYKFLLAISFFYFNFEKTPNSEYSYLVNVLVETDS